MMFTEVHSEVAVFKNPRGYQGCATPIWLLIYLNRITKLLNRKLVMID